MGYGEEKGLIPLTTEQLFRTIEERKRTEPDLKLQVEASYLEIYNEKGVWTWSNENVGT